MLVQLHKTCVSPDTQKMCLSNYTRHMLVPLHKTCVSPVLYFINLERFDMTFLWTVGTVK